MKILLLSLGSRGDAEPFAGIGAILKERGEEVVCAFPEQYRFVAEECGLPFHSLGSDYMNISNTMEARQLSSEKGLKRLFMSRKFFRIPEGILQDLRERQHAIIDSFKPDIIIHHTLCMYGLLYGMKTGTKVINFVTTPWQIHVVRELPHNFFSLSFPHRLSYRIGLFLITGRTAELANAMMKGCFTKKQIRKGILDEPMLYNVSPAIFPRPDYWTHQYMIAGFLDRNQLNFWAPPAEITEFLERHEKTVFITLGSNVNINPERNSQIIINVLEKHHIPAIVNTYGEGLAQLEDYDREHIMFVHSVPYEWIFPRMYAVIHHGGAGTTHSALRAGCASMVMPVGADQFHFDYLVAKMGAGPRGIAVSNLKEETLGPKVLDLFNNPQYRRQAEKISREMASEDYADEMYDFIVHS